MLAGDTQEARWWRTESLGEAPDGPAPLLLLAHGAGLGADSPWMESMTTALALHGISVIRFEFPYMTRQRAEERKRPPDRMPLLTAFFKAQLERSRKLYDAPVFVGGKSMGGRVASLLAADHDAAGGLAGAVCFGFPFHPPGKPSSWRTGHFTDFSVPVKIIQGTRDPFGKPDELEDRPEVARYANVCWLDSGDHDFRPLRSSGRSQSNLIEQGAKLAADFMYAIR